MFEPVPVIGSAILLPISELTRVKLGHKGTGIDMMIYGALITVISVYQPQGVWGWITSLGRGAPRRPEPGAAEPALAAGAVGKAPAIGDREAGP